MGELYLDRFHPERAQGGGQLAEAFGVGPVSAADCQRLVVEPQQVAALGHGFAFERGEDRHAQIDSRVAAMAASSPRRSALPIRSTMAPSSVTITGSWVKIASA